MARRIVGRAPVRIDFAGGWTDVPPYTHDFGGEVVNLAIDKYATATVVVDDEGILTTTYSCEVPIGSGLGTTAAINVALMAAITEANLCGGDGGVKIRDELAEKAYQFESLLNNRGGRQDQWAAAHGGWNNLKFFSEGVERLPLHPPKSVEKWLKKHLLIVNTGVPHVSGSIHESVWGRYGVGEERVSEGLLTIRKAGRAMADAIQGDRRNMVVETLREVCRGVDLLEEGLHDPFRMVVEPLLEKKEVLAWKALGAGGGGCAMLLCNLGRRDAVAAACDEVGWNVIEWAVDREGVTVTIEE